MKTFEIDGCAIETSIDKMNRNDAEEILNRLKDSEPFQIVKLRVKYTSAGELDCEYDVQPPKFERIRRITGYLTGDLTSWNDAKRHEESERVKHA